MLFYCAVLFAVTCTHGKQHVWWLPNPVYPNDTAVAYGTNLADVKTVKLCNGPQCLTVDTVQPNVNSVKFLLPSNIPWDRPLTASIGSDTVQLNGVDVWWIQGDQGNDTASLGGWLRIFGRGLAWSKGPEGPCVSARTPLKRPSTTLTIGSGTISAVEATCYSATFNIPSDFVFKSGRYPFMLTTPLGNFTVNQKNGYQFQPEPYQVNLQHKAREWPTTIYNVDGHYGGDVVKALAAAAQGGGGVVVLGPRNYQMSENVVLMVPSNTVMQGVSSTKTTLSWSHTAGTSALIQPQGSCRLQNFGVKVTATATPQAVLRAVSGNYNITVKGVVWDLQQDSMRNHMVWEGNDLFEVADSVFIQSGGCGNNKVGFVDQNILRTEGAMNGWIHNNQFVWKCTWEDVDDSERIIIEHNHINCTETPVPHGNSFSTYDSQKPLQRYIYHSNNIVHRLPFNKDAFQRETITTDGGHGDYLGEVSADYVPGATQIHLAATSKKTYGPGAGVLILDGVGAGQWRQLVSVGKDGVTVQFNEPFIVGPSKGDNVSITSNRNLHIFSGNMFVWGSVIQFYGTALENIMSDNTCVNCWDGIVTVGEDYQGGGQPNWFNQFDGNTATNSPGFNFADHGLKPPGPWYRGNVVRRASYSGQLNANHSICAVVYIGGLNVDTIVEHVNFDGCTQGAQHAIEVERTGPQRYIIRQ